MTEESTSNHSADILNLRPEDLDELLTRAAERGAERALACLGLENGHAAADIRDLRGLIPDVYEGFGRLHAAAFADGEVDRKTKELIALGISIAVRCDGCIASHAKSAAREKATEKEIAETIGTGTQTRLAISGDATWPLSWCRTGHSSCSWRRPSVARRTSRMG